MYDKSTKSVSRNVSLTIAGEWETPDELFRELDRKYHFTLDACARPENAKCQKFFTAQDDGLVQDWKGHTVFCCPPSGAAKGKDFVQSSKCGKANNPEEYALMGAIEMLLALDEHTVRDVVIYTEPVVAKIMNENANRLLDGKSPVRRKYIELAWKAMTKVSVRFVTTKVNSEYGKLALATAKYLAFCER